MPLLPAKDPRLLHGVIDLGTHSCLLLVGQLTDEGGLGIRHDVCEVPRLGEGLHETGQLGRAGMDRTMDVLGRFAATARDLGVESLTLGATAAMRRATNRQVMIDRVRDELGIELQLISEAEEAELGWIAATACLAGRGGAGEQPVVVVDVGGGSTEVVADGGARLRSFPIGGIVLTERFGTGGAKGPDGSVHNNWAGLVDCVQNEFTELADWFPESGAMPISGRPLLVALGGTPCNLGCLELGLTEFNHEAAEGVSVPCGVVLPWGERLAALSIDARAKLPVERARAAVLPAGLACLGQVAALCGAGELLVTGRGLRYGFLSKILGIG
jgi:exopolyphosphatase/guanosine-5'-triphosphate,3'-diphosphate pyrophosphatase